MSDIRSKTSLLDATGHLWTGSYSGLQRIDLNRVSDILDGASGSIAVETFGLEAGLLHLEVNGGSNGVMRDDQGLLYFSTRGGLAIVDPARVQRDAVPVPALVEEVWVDGERLSGMGPWTLDADARRVLLRFTALNPARAKELQLSARLEGFDPDWIAVGDRRELEYTNLSAGDYRFAVRVVDGTQATGYNEAAVHFTLKPHWYQTPWAILCYALCLALLVWSIIHWRLKSLQQQRTSLERQVLLRTAEVEAANASLAKLSREDALTGVSNRRRFDEALASEWKRGSRRDRELGLILIDVDHFKAYNDALGHQAGDACLRSIAQALAALHHREGDVLARYGGEEFAVLLPDTSEAEAQTAAERVRAAVVALNMPHPQSPYPVVSVSVGVATVRPSTQGDTADLVHQADRALYRAKADGRNRVVVAN